MFLFFFSSIVQTSSFRENNTNLIVVLIRYHISRKTSFGHYPQRHSTSSLHRASPILFIISIRTINSTKTETERNSATTDDQDGNRRPRRRNHRPRPHHPAPPRLLAHQYPRDRPPLPLSAANLDCPRSHCSRSRLRLARIFNCRPDRSPHRALTHRRFGGCSTRWPARSCCRCEAGGGEEVCAE